MVNGPRKCPHPPCSAAKKNQYDEMFVSPLENDCESHFAYYPNGEVVPQTTKGDYTIKILNLNTYRLREARKACYQLCESYHDDEMVKTVFLQPDENNQLQPHADIVKYFFG